MALQDLRLLSIQSHVTHGFVGNKAATFPLQCLGWDVDVLNTVNFSNHTGYGSVAGSVIRREELRGIYSQLALLRLNDYQCLLTGYVPNRELLSEIFALGKSLKESRRSSSKEGILWLMDPVMGDEGVLYVDAGVVDVYREIVRSGCVDIVTPNQYELEVLLGFPVDTEESVSRAMRILHDECNIQYVVVTSIFLDGDKSRLLAVSSARPSPSGTRKGSSSHTVIEISPVIPGYFTGVGDLFSALIVDKIHRGRGGGQRAVPDQQAMLDQCVHQTMATMNSVLRATAKAQEKSVHEAEDKKGEAPDKKKETEKGFTSVEAPAINSDELRFHELRLVECAHLFR